MGQAQSVGEADSPVTTPEVEVARRRQDYLHKLGIQKDKSSKSCSSFHHPVEAVEASDGLDSPDTLLDDGDADEVAGVQPSADVLRASGQDAFRVNFLRKLSYSKVWVPQVQRPPKHQTVIIFDWDDTLLCTSFLNLRQDAGLPATVERSLRDIQSAAKRLLEMAMCHGHTFIITNAMSGWVEYSAAKWVPDLLPVLQKVRVISARTKYEPQFPGEVGKWKVEAFLEVQRQLDSQIITNLISLGDSNFEMDAVHVMGKEFAQALIKTIKFRESPSPEELVKQLELVAQKFERIVENARNLKIGLERKWVGGSQQG
jgi:hypothetical protein